MPGSHDLCSTIDLPGYWPKIEWFRGVQWIVTVLRWLFDDLNAMKFGVKFRLIVFGLGVGLMGLLIAVVTLNSQHQAEDLRARLRQVDQESFRIADHFRDTLRGLNNTLYRYGDQQDPAEWDQFLKGSSELDAWIDQQKPNLGGVGEGLILQQMDGVYDEYIKQAKALHSRLQSQGQRGATLGLYAAFRTVTQRLFDLGQQLAKTHFETRNMILAQANKNITQLRRATLVSLGLLMFFGAAIAVVVYRDMIAPLRTQLVQSETLLERQEKLVSLGMLAAGVAHEIRNPLTAIKAALFLQQKKFEPASELFDDSKLIEREILRLERIVNDFLTFARPSEPALALTSTDRPLHEVHALLVTMLAKNKVQLVLESSPSFSIRIDPAQIKQVLINLVQNAADAAGPEGEVRLRARSDRRRLGDLLCDVAVLEVSDNGHGIPPEVQKRLFDPFFTTKDSGTGLGLSIAAGIIQKHGGALQYQTQMDYGTTFGILLPQATAKTVGAIG